MNNEDNILLELFKDLHCNMENIKESKNRIIKIKNSINSLNNIFFEVKYKDPLLTQYLNMFEDTKTYNELVINLETLITDLEYHIKNKCEHEWVNDLIDIDPDRSQQICYCVKCEITKK
jgi:hypothetical protein